MLLSNFDSGREISLKLFSCEETVLIIFLVIYVV